MSDFNELGGRLDSIATELGELSQRLQSAGEQAQARTFRVADPDGLAEAVVDGRPRVVELSLHPDALRAGPDGVDRLLTGLLNDGIDQARQATGQAMLEALPEQVRAEVER